MSTSKSKGKAKLGAGLPLEFVEGNSGQEFTPTSRQINIMEQVCNAIAAYLQASKDLLKVQYSSANDLAPSHLSEPINALVACCAEGVVVRYDRQEQDEKSKVGGAWFDKDLAEIAALLSEGFVHLYYDKDFVSTVSTTGVEVTLYSKTASAAKRTEHIKFRIGCDAVIENAQLILEPPNKPYCLLSVQNSMEIRLLGVIERDDLEDRERQKFLTRSSIRLPVGWQCIEIFPVLSLEHWKPENAAFWAKNDILSSIVSEHIKESDFQSLDPRAGARQQYSKILLEFKELLDSEPQREEILQSFLKDNPALLCPTYTRVWPKLQLGSRITDFVFSDATDDYLLVELEKSTDRLFLKDGHTSRELNHARGQVVDWKRYLEDNLSTVQQELGLFGISSNPRSLIVIGRSKNLTADNRRKLTTLENESPKTKVMTYDDVYDAAMTLIGNLLGPPWVTAPNTEIYYLPKT